MPARAPEWNAIILAGGRASRLGGIDKTQLTFRGRTLLQASLTATRSASRVAVVGRDLERTARLSSTVELPRWSGPVSAVVAGLADLRHGDAPFTAVLAADLPRIDLALPLIIARLATAATDGVIAVDSGSVPQPLLAVYRTSALRNAAAGLGTPENLPMRRLISELELTEVAVPDELCADVDTAEDAEALGIDVA